MAKTIGILTGGGDVPGLNPAIKSVVVGAMEMGYKVFGIRRGWGGLLHYDLNEPSTHDYYVKELSYNDVRIIDRTGGTFLHTSRTNPQKVKVSEIPGFLQNTKWGKPIKGTKDFVDYTDYTLNVLEHLGIDTLVPIGGDVRDGSTLRKGPSRGVYPERREGHSDRLALGAFSPAGLWPSGPDG